MPLRATAFHEAISVNALEEIFKAYANVLFAGTLATKCSKCGLRFAVFFPVKDDPQNEEWLKLDGLSSSRPSNRPVMSRMHRERDSC
jgi:hypothetical protein